MQPLVEIQRAETARRLHAEILDVLIVGGGIVGAGVARDAAMRGLRVGLVEQHDIAFGTSSRSSRLLHGGLRYLAQGRIGLVREASREKCILHRIAPHLAQPLPFVFPTYRGTKWPLWQLRIGVKVYDLLCGGQNLGRSSTLSPAELESHLPGVKPTGLTGAVRYYDGLTNDARLVTDTLQSAARSGAIVANYTRFEAASPRGDQWQCLVHDKIAETSYEVATRNIVNAAGPWAPTLEYSRVKLRLTKGVHLVVDRRRLPVPDACVMTAEDRILFAIPWGERVILGTTDTDYAGPLDDVPVERSDVDYILAVVNREFRAVGLEQGDVIGSWAGVRPLVASNSGGPSDISRAHQISMPTPGWFDVVGGKLTTYRLIGEQVVDRVAARLSGHANRCRTADEPLLADSSHRGIAAIGVVPPAVSRELVKYFCQSEWAVRPEDIMLRRTSWQHYFPDAASVAAQVRDWMSA